MPDTKITKPDSKTGRYEYETERERDPSKILLFDVDGTLTKPRLKITERMKEYLAEIRQKCFIGIVGGSDMKKQREQLGEDFLMDFDYAFAENGLVAYRLGEQIGEQSIKKFLPEDKLQEFLNFCLQYISNLELPCKRGTFIEFRTGLINVCPIGRNCSQEERLAFNAYDEEHKIRETFVQKLKERFPDIGFKYSIGGQISFDVFPVGWDKTYCLEFVKKDGFTEVHFFGDKTHEGGNDHEIFESEWTIGHTVLSPSDTRAQVDGIISCWRSWNVEQPTLVC